MHQLNMQFQIVFLLLINTMFSSSTSSKHTDDDIERNRLHIKVMELKKYAAVHSFNTSVAFLVDMNIANGKKRFFVYDLQKDSLLASGLVAHGNGKNILYARTVVFSNAEGSLCSSEGKYKIGSKYTGQFGTAYHLYGLESSNSNAFSRSVVLHAHSCVPDAEIYPSFLCNSFGCPTVSNHFLLKLSDYLDHSTKPLLLWIFK